MNSEIRHGGQQIQPVRNDPLPSPVARRILLEFTTPDLPVLGPRARPTRLSLSALDQRLDRLMAELRLPASLQPLLHAAALLWHDHLDESHTLSQSIPSPDGSFLHGIMHRREPDYGNARYWFNRVDRHPAFGPLGRRVNDALQRAGEASLARRLAPGGDWDPFAFIEACEEATHAPDDNSLCGRLREVQAIEFEQVVAHLLP